MTCFHLIFLVNKQLAYVQPMKCFHLIFLVNKQLAYVQPIKCFHLIFLVNKQLAYVQPMKCFHMIFHTFNQWNAFIWSFIRSTNEMLPSVQKMSSLAKKPVRPSYANLFGRIGPLNRQQGLLELMFGLFNVHLKLNNRVKKNFQWNRSETALNHCKSMRI